MMTRTRCRSLHPDGFVGGRNKKEIGPSNEGSQGLVPVGKDLKAVLME